MDELAFERSGSDDTMFRTGRAVPVSFFSDENERNP